MLIELQPTWVSFNKHGLTLILAWISNFTYYTVWDEIIHPFTNFNSFNCWCLGMDKYFHLTIHWTCNYLTNLGLKLIHVSKRGPWCPFDMLCMWHHCCYSLRSESMGCGNHGPVVGINAAIGTTLASGSMVIDLYVTAITGTWWIWNWSL